MLSRKIATAQHVYNSSACRHYSKEIAPFLASDNIIVRQKAKLPNAKLMEDMY